MLAAACRGGQEPINKKKVTQRLIYNTPMKEPYTKYMKETYTKDLGKRLVTETDMLWLPLVGSLKL